MPARSRVLTCNVSSTNPLRPPWPSVRTRATENKSPCSTSEEEPSISRSWRSPKESSKWKPPTVTLPAGVKMWTSFCKNSSWRSSSPRTLWTCLRTRWLSRESEKLPRKPKSSCLLPNRPTSTSLSSLLTPVVPSIVTWLWPAPNWKVWSTPLSTRPSSLVKTVLRTPDSPRTRSMKSSWWAVCPECPRCKLLCRSSSIKYPTNQWTLMKPWLWALPFRAECSWATSRTCCCWTSPPCHSVSRLWAAWWPRWSPETPPSPPRRARSTPLRPTTKPPWASESSREREKWPVTTNCWVISTYPGSPRPPEVSPKSKSPSTLVMI